MEQQKIQVPMLQKTVLTDLSEEFSIPDYQPGIKRILRVEALAMPADRYVGPGSAEFSGKLEYTLFYLGEDGEVYGSSFEGDYKVLQPLEIPGDLSFDAGILCDADIFTESATGRLLSPRKFLVKTRLHSEIRLYGERELGEEIPADCECERLCGEVLCARYLTGESEAIELFDEIPVGSADAPLRVVLCRGKVFVEEVVPGDGNLFCRGTVVVKLLTAKEEGGEAMETLTRKLPFDAEIPVDGMTPDAMAWVKGCVTESSVTVEDERILLKVEIRLLARALKTAPLTYTGDLYAIGRDFEADFASVLCPTALACGGGNFTLSARVPLAEAGLTKEQKVEDLALFPVIQEVTNEDGRLILLGKCRAQIVATEGEEWTTSEFEVPFRYDAGNCPKDAIASFLTSAEAISCLAKKEGDSIAVEAEIAVFHTILGQKEITCALSLRAGEPTKQPTAAMRICYPAPGDSLWSIGKRYGVRLSQLAEANAIAPTDSLQGVKFLVV